MEARRLAAMIVSICVPCVAWITGVHHARGAEDRELSATLSDLVEPSSHKYFAQQLRPDVPIRWALHVPGNYNPERPPGLFVFVSPVESGVIPERLKPVMAGKNLIWVSPNQAGNQTDPGLRFSYTLLAPLVVDEHYRVDSERVYLSGFSGGGRVASAIASRYPELFRGAIYICGVNSWGPKRPAAISRIRSNRYVFLTGSEDFNRSQTRGIYREYKRAAVKGIQFMEVEHMGHRLPPADRLAAAIDFLDGGNASQ